MNLKIKELTSKRRTSKEIYVAIEMSRSTFYRNLSGVRNELGNRVGQFWSPSQVRKIIEHVSPN